MNAVVAAKRKKSRIKNFNNGRMGTALQIASVISAERSMKGVSVRSADRVKRFMTAQPKDAPIVGSTFSAPAILTRVAYLKDGGLSLGFATNELTDEEKVTVSRFHQKYGYVLFKENQFKDEEIPEGDAEMGGKSPSQRLRAVLFVYWKQLGSKENFEVFYRVQMERAIDRVKKCLDD